MRSIIKILSIMVLLIIVTPKIAYGADFTIPSGSYSFTNSGILSDSSGKERKDLFDDILKAKQLSVVEEFNKRKEAEFSNRLIAGDLEIVGGGSFWFTQPNDLKTRTSGTTFIMKQRGIEYKIYVPPGMSGGKQINIAVINNAIAGMEKYKLAVSEGVLVGSLGGSYNVYSMYPDKQVPLTDILEEKVDNGKKTGIRTIKASGAGVTMKYTLDYFMNPLFGKMDSTDLKTSKTEENQKFWEGKIKDVKLSLSNDNKNVEFEVNSAYMTFLEEDKSGESTLSKVDSNSVVKSDGVKSYKSTITKREVKPQSTVDGAMQLIVPSLFSKKLDSSVYSINKEKGYKVIEGVKFLISHNFVYSKDGEGYKRLGNYESFGIDDSSIVVYSIKLNKEGKFDVNGKEVGAVIPLWFKEAVVNVSEDKETASTDDLYMTGRVIKLGNDYSGKITLDATNKDLFSVDSKTDGKQGVAIRRFSFAENSDYLSSKDHFNLDTAPDSFRIHVNFENLEVSETTEEGEEASGNKGFFIYRNNWYVNDPDLIKWLESNEAKALTDVKAEKLYGIITGKFELNSTELSYEEWLRLQEIRAELDVTLKDRLISAIRIVLIIFGFLLIFYSILLVIAYWLDIFNVLVEFSFLNMLTKKRLYPISTKDDLEYITYSGGEVKYVTFWNVLLLMLVGIAIGIVFIYSIPIIEFVLYIYYKVTSWLGVI